MQIRKEAIQRVGECDCGALKVIAAGEPERVYLCHCKARQRRTGTAFLFGVTYRSARVRLEGEYKIYERDADSGSRIRFFLSDLRQQFALGERAQPDAVRGGRRRPRELRSFANLGNFRRVAASLARTAERDRTSPPRPVVCRELKAVQ